MSDPAGQHIGINFKSDVNRVIHFYEWEFVAIWGDHEDGKYQAYSKIKGMMVPQAIHIENKNLTTAFRGPVASEIYVQMTPTYYTDEI
jgi:hypothetical protein